MKLMVIIHCCFNFVSTTAVADEPVGNNQLLLVLLLPLLPLFQQQFVDKAVDNNCCFLMVMTNCFNKIEIAI